MKKHNFYSAILETRKDKKFIQRLEELEINTDFQKEIDALRKKWCQQIERSFQITEEMGDVIREEGFKGPENLTEVQEKRLRSLQKESTNFLLNKDLINDSVEVAKKFHLYPADNWSTTISFIIFGKPEDSYLHRAFFSNNYFSKNFKNCDVIFQKNLLTNEKELFIKIFPDTSLEDIKITWKEIVKTQKRLRENIGWKRFYPKTSIPTAKKLKELDTKDIDDWQKQEIIYGESRGADWGKKEVKRKANLRQIRKRYKI